MIERARPPILSSVLLLLFFGIIVFPIAWMILTAFKQPRDVYSLTFVFTPTIENFFAVFQPPWNIGQRILNSVIVAAATLAIGIPAAILAPIRFRALNSCSSAACSFWCWQRSSSRQWSSSCRFT